MSTQNEVWEKILDFSKSSQGKHILLLNPTKGAPFTITEVSNKDIRIDKLPIKNDKTHVS